MEFINFKLRFTTQIDNLVSCQLLKYLIFSEMLFRRLYQSSVATSRVLQTRLTSSKANPDPGANEQQDIPHFTFSEEPLGLPASEGFGYFQGGPGLKLGPDCRFKLQAKLGFGTTSSVWLARDCM